MEAVRNKPLNEGAFERGVWRDLVDRPLNTADARTGWINVPVLFLASAVDSVGLYAPDAAQMSQSRLWAAKIIVRKVSQGDLRLFLRRGIKWLPFPEASWRHRRMHGELGNLFGRCAVEGDREGDWFVYVEQAGLERLIDHLRHAADALPRESATRAVPGRKGARKARHRSHRNRHPRSGVARRGGKAAAWERSRPSVFGLLSRRATPCCRA